MFLKKQFLPLKKNLSNLQSFRAKDLVFIFFVLTRLTAIFFSSSCVTDVPLYLDWFEKLKSGLIPYVQFSFEYPPLTLIPIYLAGIFNPKNFEEYYLGFALVMICADFFLLNICKRFCKNKLSMNEREISYMTLLYSLFGLLLFRILYHRLDLLISLFFVTSLVFFGSETSKLKKAFFLNAVIGFFYKIIPAFIMPSTIIIKAFKANLSVKKTLQKILVNSLIFISSLAAIIWILEVFTNYHFVENMLFHQERGIQIESSYSSILLLKNLLKIGTNSEVYNSFGAFNIAGNVFFETFAKVFGSLVFLGFWGVLFAIFLNKKITKKVINFSEAQFLELTLITILLFISFQRVLSLQFFVWLIPVLAIWLAKNRSIKFLIVFCFLFFCSFFIFSINYYALINQAPIMVATIFMRNLVLVIFTSWLAINFLKKLQNDKN